MGGVCVARRCVGFAFSFTRAASRAVRRRHSLSVKFPSLRCCGYRWMAVVLRLLKRTIDPGGMLVARLFGRRLGMPLATCRLFRYGWPGVYSA
jgi:hypothetical protein